MTIPVPGNVRPGGPSRLCDFRTNVVCKSGINVGSLDDYLFGHRKPKVGDPTMTTISHALSQYRLGGHRRHSRSAWHDAGIGLALVLVVMTMVVIGGQARRESQPYLTSPVAEDRTSLGWENSVAPDLFPLGPLGADVSR